MRTKTIGTLEAKTRLSALLAEVEKGQRFLIARHGRPIAELRPVGRRRRAAKAGFARGAFSYVADDFDASPTDFDDCL